MTLVQYKRKRKSIATTMLLSCCFIIIFALLTPNSTGFVPHPVVSGAALVRRQQISQLQRHHQQPSQQEQQDAATTSVLVDQATRLREEAERIRLEAEKLDMSLTLSKIGAIEQKLSNPAWLEKHPEEREKLEGQLKDLQKKIGGTEQTLSTSPTISVAPTVTPRKITVETNKSERDCNDESTMTTSSLPARNDDSSSVSNASPSTESQTNSVTRPEKPIAGFDDIDLGLYIPVAMEIEERMSNATLEERLQAFRAAPELQDHFQEKIASMLVKPMEDLQKVEELRSKYLYSTSSKEKEQVKRELDRLEAKLEKEGPFTFTDSLNLEIPPMPEEEMKRRIDALTELPPVLQSLYKRRVGLSDEHDLRLAVEFDHYEEQIQILEQVQVILPLTEETYEELEMALTSLPSSVRDHFAKEIGLENGNDIEEIIEELTGGDFADSEPNNPLQNVFKAASNTVGDVAVYSDIEFVDRSRYIQEFYPCVARMEDKYPSKKLVDEFVATVIDKKAFMVTSKPERVVGGYYIYGQNLLSDDEDGVKLVERMQKRLYASQLSEKVEFFYIPDPSPLTDEQIELDEVDLPIILVTTKNQEEFYNSASPIVKGLLTTVGMASIAIFSLGAVALQPTLAERIDSSLATNQDIEWLKNIYVNTALSVTAIQLIHEIAHKVVAWKDKFEIGWPTLIPSLQFGLQGAITPIRSPPPSMKSLFDFAVAGPFSGAIASLAFFVTGLSMTASMDINQVAELPALPAFLLRSSALGGGLIELFLGQGALSQGLNELSVLPLHPFAIAGFVGILSNALALLPLGNTDGGRIATAMFGRRWTYILSSFTLATLCAVGLFGADESRILIIYCLFAAIWQREQETPARNEVAELDFARGVLGIAGALFVALALLPMP